MAQTNVSSCVLSIVGSFSSGLDVFKKLREKRKRKRQHGHRRDGGRKCDLRAEEDESRLSRSLRQGPEDIGREYARSVYAVGDGFAIGDALAQTSLAEILLKLSTGLVGIISSFLNSDRRSDMQLDYQTLTQLSDRSREDTCRALRQLFKRMTQPRPLPAITAYEDYQAQEQRKPANSPKRKRKPSTSHTKVKGPMLARVVIQDSSKPSQIAIVKPSDRRKKSTSTSSSSSELSKASSTPSTPPPKYAPEPPPRPVAVRSKTAPAAPASKPRRNASAVDLPTQPTPQPEPRQAACSTPRLQTLTERQQAEPWCTATLPSGPTAFHYHAQVSSPPYVNSAAQSTPALPRSRKPTPTYYSIASDSTRLGEIPLHKWNAPADFDQMSMLNREAERNGWPANEIGAGQDVEGRRRGWGLRRLFGRK